MNFKKIMCHSINIYSISNETINCYVTVYMLKYYKIIKSRVCFKSKEFSYTIDQQFPLANIKNIFFA